MTTIIRPVPFPGTPEQAKANRDTHYFDREDYRCVDCDSRFGHVAASYPCGSEVPTHAVEVP